MELIEKFRLQFISHCNDRYSYLDSVRLALEGGCRWIQLRIKEASDEEVSPLAAEAKELCRRYGATFIIDDRVRLVKEIQADGVHLGKNDMPPAKARELLGNRFIIGGTANTFVDIKALAAAGVDYIGCGPFRFTTTKRNLAPILGMEGYREIITRMRDAGIELPIVAIGGITAEDVPGLISTGLSGIAVSGAILNVPDPTEEVKHLISILKSSF